MQIVIDLEKYRGKEIELFDNIIWKINIDNSFYIDMKHKRLIPLKQAPREIITNLSFMKLKNIKIYHGKNIDFESGNPTELLNKLKHRYYVYGFQDRSGIWSPQYVDDEVVQSPKGFRSLSGFNASKMREQQKFFKEEEIN